MRADTESDTAAATRAAGAATPEVPSGNYVFIESDAALVAFLAEIEASGGAHPIRCAVDTEADSLHSYREKLCLVQFHAAGRNALIDPLRVQDLSPLMDFLRQAEVWMHGADFDMQMLQRTFDELPETIYDTQIVARLIGYRKFGLAALIEDVFGVVLSKSSQRADWGMRPLTDKMLGYAVNDVRYLLPLADHLLARLRELGREEWFEQSCADAKRVFLERPVRGEDDFWRISGWGKLRPQGLAFLRAVWRWRDTEAARLDRPSFKVCNNEPLLTMARQLQDEGTCQLPARLRGEPLKRLKAAIDEARALPKEDWPARKPRLTGRPRQEDEAKFNALRDRRNAVAAELGIDETLLGTRAVLEILSVRPEEAKDLLMPWQLEQLFPDGQVAAVS